MGHDRFPIRALFACLICLPLISCGGGGDSSSPGGGSSGGSGTSSSGSSTSSSSGSSSTSSSSSGASSSSSSSSGAISFVLKNQDAAVHAPPSGVTAAQYDYNLFTPNAANFPAVGGTYTDPVFGAPVRRLTNVMGHSNYEDIYAHHWANADGTFAFTRSSTQFDIVRIADGTKPYLNQPTGSIAYEIQWDALDPDKYYYYSGASLVRRNLAAQTNTTIKTFPAALESLGGSLNAQSREGRYFVVQYGGTAKVWDSQTDTLYAGSFAPLDSTGWVSITPDAKYVVTAGGLLHYSYAIDHTAKSIASSPVMFWDRCGDHGVLISPSDGKSYFITHSCYNTPGIYRVDIAKDQSGRTDAQQLADNQLLLNAGWGDDDGHLSAVSRGPLANWVFVDTENFTAQFEPYDDFNSSTAGWTPYKQEIIAINVITLEIRRLAHHRSRGLNANYYNQPRVSCAWDGSVVLWTSNYNLGSPSGYADMYAIQTPIQ